MKQLLIGCGNSRNRLVSPDNNRNWKELITLDIDPLCKPDVLWDLDIRPLPFDDNTFSEIHAYEVLEHLGRQGDWRGFFKEFTEYWRLLMPNGYLVGSVPQQGTKWVWADPGHTRELSDDSFVFLDQTQYTKQIGRTTMTDYRSVYTADFGIAHLEHRDDTLFFAIQAIKPSRFKSTI